MRNRKAEKWVASDAMITFFLYFVFCVFCFLFCVFFGFSVFSVFFSVCFAVRYAITLIKHKGGVCLTNLFLFYFFIFF